MLTSLEFNLHNKNTNVRRRIVYVLILLTIMLAATAFRSQGLSLEVFPAQTSRAASNQVYPGFPLPTFDLPYSKDTGPNWSSGPHQWAKGPEIEFMDADKGSGLDFAGGNFKVLAMADGEVIYAQSVDLDCNLGIQVAIRHTTGGSVIRYGHLNSIDQKILDGVIATNGHFPVTKGTVLGIAGHTGMKCLEPLHADDHLHIELRDGTRNCCIGNNDGGNPISWDNKELNGYRIYSYRPNELGVIGDKEHSVTGQAYNYEGLAIKIPINPADAYYPVEVSQFSFYDSAANNPGIKYPVTTFLPRLFPLNECSKTHNCEQISCDGLTYAECVEKKKNSLVQFSGGGYIGGGGVLISDQIPLAPDPSGTAIPGGTADGISLCDATNYGPPCKSYIYTDNSTCNNLTDTGMNDKAESLQFAASYAGKYEVIFYGDNACADYNARYGSNTSDLGGLKNAFGSLRIEYLTQPVYCPTSPEGVTLYSEANFGGTCHTFGPGDYPDLSLFGLLGNVSSIYNPSGAFMVRLNDQLNFAGQPGVFDNTIPDMAQHGWQDRAYSLHVERHIPTDCNPVSDGVNLYVDINFGSGCIGVTNDIADLRVYGLQNALDSLQFVGSYRNTTQILLYRQANWTDLCGTYWLDQDALRSCAGQAVSIRILPFSAPTPIPTQPGTVFSGNIAPQAYLYPSSAAAVVDGDLATEWIGGHGSASDVYFSWPAPVSIHRLVITDLFQSTVSNNQINTITVALSNGLGAVGIDMTSGGPRCVDITFPAQSGITWVAVKPWDSSGENGYREIEIWAVDGPQYSNNTCVMAQNVTLTPLNASAPPIVATSFPVPTTVPTRNLVVSTVAAESTDGQAHDAANPLILSGTIELDSLWIKQGARVSVPAWDGNSGGTLCFNVTGTAQIDGVLSADGVGYRGGQAAFAGSGYPGESYLGFYSLRSEYANGGGGGGGAQADSGGAGGGYGTPGQPPVNDADVAPVYGGNTYGDPILTTLFLGSGGGSSGSQAYLGGAGGNGGGAICIYADTINVSGLISANGANGTSGGTLPNLRGGGGGSGGSLHLHANHINFLNGIVTALGGHGGYGIRDGSRPASGGVGGVGRILVEYGLSLVGVTSPEATVVHFQVPPTITPSATASPTATSTQTSTPTATATSTSTATATSLPTMTATPTATASPTQTPTATYTMTPTSTAIATSTSTATATSSPTMTATSTATASPTQTPTATASPTSTSTPVPTATVAMDWQAPTIANLTKQGPNATCSVTIITHAKDNVGVVSVQLAWSRDHNGSITGMGSMPMTRISGQPRNGRWSATFTLKGWKRGERLVIDVRAADLFGNNTSQRMNWAINRACP